jgi:hypothetical protein
LSFDSEQLSGPARRRLPGIVGPRMVRAHAPDDSSPSCGHRRSGRRGSAGGKV